MREFELALPEETRGKSLGDPQILMSENSRDGNISYPISASAWRGAVRKSLRFTIAALSSSPVTAWTVEAKSGRIGKPNRRIHKVLLFGSSGQLTPLGLTAYTCGGKPMCCGIARSPARFT